MMSHVLTVSRLHRIHSALWLRLHWCARPDVLCWWCDHSPWDEWCVVDGKYWQPIWNVSCHLCRASQPSRTSQLTLGLSLSTSLVFTAALCDMFSLLCFFLSFALSLSKIIQDWYNRCTRHMTWMHGLIVVYLLRKNRGFRFLQLFFNRYRKYGL